MMNQKEKMRKYLLEELDDYFMQLVYLKDLLSVEEDIHRSEDRLQSAPNFTLIVECALIDSYMILLMKLYDKSDKTQTIPNLIKKCKNNSALFKTPNDTLSKLNDFETRLSKDEYISHAIKTLTSRRDSIYAHNDKKYFGKKLIKDTSDLKMYHIWALVNYTEEVLNYLFSHLSSNEEKRKTKYNQDLSNLLERKETII